MSQNTPIEWTDATWNPVRGCSRVTEGCRNCYAERTAARFSGPRIGQTHDPFHGFVTRVNGHAAWTGKVQLIERHLEDPLHWKKPQRIFVNSMSDLFHESLPYDDKRRVLEVIRHADWHTYQVLTKRPADMLATMERYYGEYFDSIGPEAIPLKNLQLGVSPHDQPSADAMIPLLLQTPAAVRFVSYEPALGPVDFSKWLPAEPYRGKFDIDWLDWIIVGGESGPGARPFDIAWARNAVAQCKAGRVACFVKQLGAKPEIDWSIEDREWPDHCIPDFTQKKHDSRKVNLGDKKGGDWEEWPADLRVREFPVTK